MNLQKYTEYANELLSSMTSNSTEFNLSEQTLRQIRDMNASKAESTRAKKTTYPAVSGNAFKLPASLSSMPYITGIKDDKIELTTIEPATLKTEAKSTVSDDMKGTRGQNFKKVIPHLNKAAFKDGIDLDNFAVLNISERPLGKEDLTFLAEKGGIIPLGTNHGVFVPQFAMDDATWMSVEYESRFTDVPEAYGDQKEAFDIIAGKPIKDQFGFDVRDLLSHDAGNNASYKAYYDSTVVNKGGREAREVVFGAAPLSNVVMAMHSAFSAWEKTGAVHDDDKVMDRSAGMHISTTAPAVSKNPGKVSEYLHNAGIMVDVLSRTSERWKSDSGHLGIPSGSYDGNRNDFRMDGNTDRLEMRYPSTVMDIGYVTDQLVMAHKITSDAQTYADSDPNTARTQSPVERATKLQGDDKAKENLWLPLHASTDDNKSRLVNQWFDKTMEVLGITDDFTKQYVKSMNSRCAGTNAPG